MFESLFSDLPRSRARHLFDQGMWLTGKAGDTLTYEGELVSHLYYLAEGEARVLSMGRQVGLCRAGDLIGELTVLSGENATATVILNTPARFWCAPAEDLRPYVEAHEDIRRAIEHGFATVLKAKLRARTAPSPRRRRGGRPCKRDFPRRDVRGDGSGSPVCFFAGPSSRRRMTRFRISVMSSIAKRTPSRPRPLNP